MNPLKPMAIPRPASPVQWFLPKACRGTLFPFLSILIPLPCQLDIWDAHDFMLFSSPFICYDDFHA